MKKLFELFEFDLNRIVTLSCTDPARRIEKNKHPDIHALNFFICSIISFNVFQSKFT